jgi:hypothetical protein
VRKINARLKLGINICSFDIRSLTAGFPLHRPDRLVHPTIASTHHNQSGDLDLTSHLSLSPLRSTLLHCARHFMVQCLLFSVLTHKRFPHPHRYLGRKLALYALAIRLGNSTNSARAFYCRPAPYSQHSATPASVICALWRNSDIPQRHKKNVRYLATPADRRHISEWTLSHLMTHSLI